ncbi:MAG TPA: hypothetical protein VNK41_09880 [Vicinamibacterales bacterium]|nr:hypothetical protein [Vicinamibacterales bacterium]
MDTLLILLTIAASGTMCLLLIEIARLKRGDRERSEARIALLEAEARAGMPEPEPAVDEAAEERAAVGQGSRSALPRPIDNAFTEGSLFVDRQPQLSSSIEWRRAVAAAAVPCIGATVVILTLITDRAPSADPADRPATAVPLELLSLEHERRESTLFVRGAVRVPSEWQTERIDVLIDAFDTGGREVGRARASVSADAAGLSSRRTFTTTIPEAAAAARYRVRFARGQQPVPHRDRRSSSGDPLSARR